MEALQADPAVLLALAERCEKASGPDRELDVAIAYATIPGAELASDDLAEAGELWVPCDDSRADSALVGAANYTASIDAALTLADGMAVDMFIAADRTRTYTECGPILHVKAVSAALALCAAALRARAHLSAQRPSTPSVCSHGGAIAPDESYRSAAIAYLERSR